MHSKIENIEIMISDDANDVIKKLLKYSIENRYHNNLESVRGTILPSIMFSHCIVNVIR